MSTRQQGRLWDAIAIVTGGASGIGAAAVRRLAAEGASVLIADLDQVAGEALEFELAGAGQFAKFAKIDTCNTAEVNGCVDGIVKEKGRIDILVTAAGRTSGRVLADTDALHMSEILDLNVLGTFHWMRAVTPLMSARRAGAIVTVGSQLTYSGAHGNFAYAASKGAISAMTRAAAIDLAEHGVRVNSVVPAIIDTPLSRTAIARRENADVLRERLKQRHLLSRFGHPEEVAAAIYYLAAEATFTTGAEVMVDGGWLTA